MLERQPADVQDLLLRTSLLDRVNGELADLLTGRPGSERILLDLEDANAFVVSLDPERTWFRYHHLFADLLRLELRRTLPEEVPALHRRAAAWFIRARPGGRGHPAHPGGGRLARRGPAARRPFVQPDARRAGADHRRRCCGPSRRARITPSWPWCARRVTCVQGRLDEAAAHLAVAETYAETAPPDRQRRLRVAIASLKLSLARRRGHLAGVLEQARFLASPVTGQSDEDIALGSDLRAVALMNLGIVEAWSLGLPDAERHLQEGADLARKIGRPYLEVGCLAQLGFASKIRSFATTRRRCHEAIALAERHGWGAEPVIAPALVTLAGTLIWTGEFDEGERWLQRTEQALQTDTGPGIRLLLHLATGMLHAGRGRHHEALEEFGAAEHLQSQLAGSHALASQVTGWTAGHPGPPRDARRGPRRRSRRSTTSGPARARSAMPAR